MELLLCFVVTFAILTFILSVREMSYKKVFHKPKADSIIIISLYSDDFSEIYLKYQMELIKNSRINTRKVVLLDKGLEPEQYKICENIVKYNDMLELVNANEFFGCIEVLLK